MKANKSKGAFFITGATGFIGACLARSLLQKGAEVHIIARPSSNLWRIESILDLIHCHEGDLMDFDGLKRILNEVRPNVIFHLAAYGAYPTKQIETTEILKTNLIGTVNLLKASEEINYEVFINTGSSSEYGIKNKAMSESDLPEPYNDYGVAKLAATSYCQAYGRNNKRPVMTYRLFSVYGQYEEGFRLIPSIMKACVENSAIKLSSPDPVRDFIHVDDVVDAYINGVGRNHHGEIFNIGSGSQHSIGEIIEIVKKIMPEMPNVVWGSMENPRIEPKKWCADMEKSKKLLQLKPGLSLEQGLRQTYEWFQKNRKLYL